MILSDISLHIKLTWRRISLGIRGHYLFLMDVKTRKEWYAIYVLKVYEEIPEMF